MHTVKTLIDEKGGSVWSISPNATVFQALQLLDEKDIGALLVIDGQALVGVISERDYARKVVLKGKNSQVMQVREIMSSPVITVSPTANLEFALELMTNNHIRHLPVLKEDVILGVLSMRDVMAAIIERQGDTIRFLEDLAGDI